MGRLAVAAAAVAMLAATAAAAQEQAVPADGKAATQCELHVWPGRGFHTVYYGWAHGGTIDGAQKGRDGYPPIPDEPLSVAVQLEQLRALPLPDLLGLPDYAVVLHDTPLAAREIRGNGARHAQASPPCYAELMIDDIVFQDNVINGKWLNVIFRFHRFDGAGAEPSRTFGNYILARLHVFPPSDPNVDPKPALDELVDAYAQTVRDFGRSLQAPQKEKKKK